LAEDAVASYTDSLHVEARQDGTEVTVIVVEGSLDQHSSASDRACVDEAVGTRPGSVAVDARGLTFCQCVWPGGVVAGASCGDRGRRGVPSQ
jgi:hypothetical protein